MAANDDGVLSAGEVTMENSRLEAAVREMEGAGYE